MKGISSPVQYHDSSSEPNQAGDKSTRFGFGEMFENTLNLANGHASQTLDWVQENFQGGMSNIAMGSRAVTSATQNLGSDIYRRRINVWRHMIDIPDQSSKFITNLLLSGKRTNHKPVVLFQSAPSESNVSALGKGRKLLLSDSTKRQISDEIGVVADPSRNFTHMLFLYMVHFYLVLLLIVSVPDSYTIRLVVKRPSASSIDSDSEEPNLRKSLVLGQVNLNGGIEFVKDEAISTQGSEKNQMKKALSYYL